jgi:alkylation response protein AidB-like acyl-CoA dehydrogenase
MLAESLALAEIARASLHAAGVVVDDPEIADVDRAVAGARVLTAQAATTNASTCIQVHGGIGFTWEFDAHLFLKRAWALSGAFGSADQAADIVARRLIAQIRP